MSDNYITADLTTLFNQSKSTALEYINEASCWLDKDDNYENTFENAIRIAELMNNDFRTTLIALNIQSLSASIDEFAEKLDGINLNIHLEKD